MTKVSDVTKALFKLAPYELKEEWDNVGLLVGNEEKEVKKILVALDVTEGVAREAAEKKADLIVSHHPIIFEPLRNLVFEGDKRKLEIIVKNDISVISMHTNLDKTMGGVNDILMSILDVCDVKEAFSGLGRIGSLKKELTLKEFVKRVKNILHISALRYTGDDEALINKVACLGGSGADFISEAKDMGADVFLTSEVKHHIGILSNEIGIPIIDAGHFETENPVTFMLADYLRNNFDCECEIATSNKRVFKNAE